MTAINYLPICAVACLLIGCGSEDSSSPSTGVESQQPVAPAAANQGQSTPQYQAVVSDRTIDYIQGLVERRAYDQARQALTQLAGSQLTPEQQRRVDALKARIPAN